jgi:TIR domain
MPVDSRFVKYDPRMPQETAGFWSYVRKDDRGMHGAIRRLAKHVIEEYGVLTGQDLDLFFDSASLKWGDDWESKIRQALEETTFFIPIITPRYFASEECRNELLSFAAKAEELDRLSLILPIYFVDVPALNEKNFDDPAVRLIARRHREDWRTLRLLDETVQPYRVGVSRLAARLLDVARDRQRSLSPRISDQSGEEEDEGPPALAASPPIVEQGTELQVDEERGLIELLAEGEEALPRIVETLEAITEQIQSVGEIAQSGTKEIEESDEAGGGFRGRLAAMNQVAKHLKKPADELETLTSRYAADLLILDPAMKQLIPLANEEAEDDPDSVRVFFEGVQAMADSSGTAAGSVLEMIRSMEGDQFSRELRAPLQRMRVSLQSLVDGQQLIEAWRDQIDALATKKSD